MTMILWNTTPLLLETTAQELKPHFFTCSEKKKHYFLQLFSYTIISQLPFFHFQSPRPLYLKTPSNRPTDSKWNQSSIIKLIFPSESIFRQRPFFFILNYTDFSEVIMYNFNTLRKTIIFRRKATTLFWSFWILQTKPLYKSTVR